MIEIKNLTKKYETNDGKDFHAVNGVSLSINDGEIFGIIGKSGAGKSTLVRCINRLEEADGGEIFIDDTDILKLNEKDLMNQRRNVSMIFQNFNLFKQKTVGKNIAFPMELEKWPKEKIKNRVKELLDFVDLSDKENDYPSNLSGGQMQRVAIARAIALNPKVILSDESTSALDPTTTKSILNLLKKIVEKYKSTIILITHQMEVAKDICDRIAVMDKGKIIELQTVNELFSNPKTEITKSFIKNLVHDDEEEIINQNDFEGTVLRITFDKDTFNKPILSEIVKKTNVDINIIQGNINVLNSSKVGYTIAEVVQNNRVDEVIKVLKEFNVNAEVLK